jgi:predicted SnoaL-like aldol condensation-catalyzing enzyme
VPKEIIMRKASLLVATPLGVVAAICIATISVQTASATDKDKVLAQRFHLDMIQKGDLQLADQIIAPDCVIHLPSGTSDVKGPERAKQVAGGDLKAFPKGIKINHDVVFGEGNLVGFHWTFVGTRDTGEETHLEGIDMVRITNGKISEMWIEYHNIKK